MISFACGELGCTLGEAYDMTWAEFRIRSFAFNRVSKRQAKLFREVAYEVHGVKYMFGNKKPPKKEAYWPIDGGVNQGVSDKAKQRFSKAWEEYQRKVKEKNGTD